ncbi:hypothetical protein CC78DRAFT_577976 [Lojkania enalia]|uniref:Only prolin and serin are matching in the corresponding protein n=1 Tax=Lojkania enalia TaxID=147567 RepID=A0A9P4KCD9_9PLEO|nr:hypothetical protein CC78DRAFT_577976 [Didymosphaeria enalia]
MRDLKPLALPTYAARRKSSKSSFEMNYEPTSSIYSNADSGFYSASDCSTPPTPSISSRAHLRHPSSNSSLSSSPPAHEPIEVPNSSGKLPKLTEEPVEREDEYITSDPFRPSCDNEPWEHSRSLSGRLMYGAVTYDFADDYFSHDSELHLSKRRRSVESTTNSITNKIERRFPSLSRRVRENRKRASTLGKTSRSATPSRVPSTRSSSMTSSIQQVFDSSEKFPPTPAQSSKERLDELLASSPIDIAKANSHDSDAEEEEEEEERFATTPLLPPLLIKARLDDVPAQSPLQSPTIADTTYSLVATPIDTPPARAFPTPPLSSKPSVSSFKASRPGHMVPSSDIPPIMLTDPNDKWAIKLGHANFTIQPEPYVPEICDTTSLRQLFADWEQARCNFTKHQVRTGEHFGVTSKTYLLTEQKWTEIDALWKRNHDLALSRAAALGEEPEPTSPLEPAPLSKMPTLSDPRGEGKFPKLGDEDIVGPMVQIASQLQKQPSRKRAFFQLFRDIKFPGSFLGRSSTRIRATK